MMTNKISLENLRSSLTLNNFVIILVFLFPITAATVKGAGGLIMFTLLVIGLFSFRLSDLNLLDKDKYIFIGFLALFLVGALSMINTENVIDGYKKLERLSEFPLSIFIYLYFIKNRLNLARVLISGIMVAAIVMAWQAWYEIKVLGGHIAQGGYHKIIFGDMAMLLAVLLGAHAYFNVVHWKEYILFILLVVLALYASLMSNTRGAWILIPILLVFMAGYVILKHRSNIRYLTAVVFLVSLIALIIFENAYIYHNFTNEFVQILKEGFGAGEEFSSLRWRTNLWAISFDIWKNNLFLGTGLGDFATDVLKTSGNSTEVNGVFFADHAHSIFFDSLATMGVVGLVVVIVGLYVIPLCAAYKTSRAYIKRRDEYDLIVLGFVLLAFFVFGISEGWLSRKPFIHIYVLFLLIAVSSIKLNTFTFGKLSNEETNTFSSFFWYKKRYYILLLLISFVFHIAFLFGQGWLLDYRYYSSLSPVSRFQYDYKNGEYDSKLVVFDKNNKLSDVHSAYKLDNNIESVCAGSSSILFVTSKLPINNVSEMSIIKSYQSDNGDELYVSNILPKKNCPYKYMSIDVSTLTVSAGPTVGESGVAMMSNGSLGTPIITFHKGKNIMIVDASSDCKSEECAKMRISFIRKDKKIIYQEEVYTHDIESKHFVSVVLKENIEGRVKIEFINDYWGGRPELDINLYIKALTLAYPQLNVD